LTLLTVVYRGLEIGSESVKSADLFERAAVEGGVELQLRVFITAEGLQQRHGIVQAEGFDFVRQSFHGAAQVDHEAVDADEELAGATACITAFFLTPRMTSSAAAGSRPL